MGFKHTPDQKSYNHKSEAYTTEHTVPQTVLNQKRINNFPPKTGQTLNCTVRIHTKHLQNSRINLQNTNRNDKSHVHNADFIFHTNPGQQNPNYDSEVHLKKALYRSFKYILLSKKFKLTALEIRTFEMDLSCKQIVFLDVSKKPRVGIQLLIFDMVML